MDQWGSAVYQNNCQIGNARLNNPLTVHTLRLSNVDRKLYDGYKQSQIHTSWRVFSFEKSRALTGNSIAFHVKVNDCEVRQLF